jgi:hypothetical protein
MTRWNQVQTAISPEAPTAAVLLAYTDAGLIEAHGVDTEGLRRRRSTNQIAEVLVRRFSSDAAEPFELIADGGSRILFHDFDALVYAPPTHLFGCFGAKIPPSEHGSQSVRNARVRLGKLTTSNLWVQHRGRSTNQGCSPREVPLGYVASREGAAITFELSEGVRQVLDVPAAPAVKIANCDLESSTSSCVSWNMKSSGKRRALRLTASLRRPVVTP